MKKYLTALFCISVSILLLFLTQQVSLASNDAKNCHCFRNRTFNPEDKYISDDYLLTTTFNSLLASEFNIPKRQIVMMKMRDGVANNDLMTALYVSQQIGPEVAQLFQMRKEKTWQEIIPGLLTESTPPETEKLFNFITKKTSNDQIADQITHRMITSRFSPLADSLDSLSKKGLGPREIILTFTLADYKRIPLEQITNQYLINKKSWSEIAHNLGLQPSEVGKLLEKPKTTK